jgi:hypothetical protein
LGFYVVWKTDEEGRKQQIRRGSDERGRGANIGEQKFDEVLQPLRQLQPTLFRFRRSGVNNQIVRRHEVELQRRRPRRSHAEYDPQGKYVRLPIVPIKRRLQDKEGVMGMKETGKMDEKTNGCLLRTSGAMYSLS